MRANTANAIDEDILMVIHSTSTAEGAVFVTRDGRSGR